MSEVKVLVFVRVIAVTPLSQTIFLHQRSSMSSVNVGGICVVFCCSLTVNVVYMFVHVCGGGGGKVIVSLRL